MTMKESPLQQLDLASYQVDPAFPPDKETGWPYPREDDGWTHAHNSLRGEMEDFKQALRQVKERGVPLQEWEVKAIQEAMKAHHEHVHDHHTNEDHILMPEVQGRFKVRVP